MAEVLFGAIGGDRSRLTAACDYYRNDCTATLLALTVHGRPVGVAGYEVGRSAIALRHIAVVAQRRRTGIARRLLAEIRSRHPDSDLVAETDAAALGFHLAAGFAVTALGEKYPGVERFRVDLPGLSPERPAGPPARGGVRDEFDGWVRCQCETIDGHLLAGVNSSNTTRERVSVASKTHHYEVDVIWTGNTGTCTSGYREYERAHDITAAGKPVIAGTADPAFRGVPERWNPEELLVAGLSHELRIRP